MYKVKLNEKSNPDKPVNIKPRRRRSRFLLYPLLFIGTFLTLFAIDYVFFSGKDLFSRSNIIKAVSTGTNLVNRIVNLELKNDDGITSVLIAGIDTRNIVFEDGAFKSTKPQGQAGTRNIDTIIQVVYDHNKNELVMISIPRDLGVDVREECLKFSGSIHWVYDKAETAKCPGRGIEELKHTVESVTGIPIQYHVFVTLDSFVEAIETVGETNPTTGEVGIYVDNPTDVWDVYPYNDYGWENVYFKKGNIFLSGEDALKYVRVRQLTSDFGRARRQQIVIEAVIGRVLSSDTLLDGNKIAELYRIYRQKTLVSEVSFKEILAGVDLIQKVNTGEIVNIVLDPEISGSERYLDKQPHNRPGGPYYMVPTHWKECPGDEFCKVKQLIRSIIENPTVFEEEAKVFAYATSNYQGRLYFDDPTYKAFMNIEPPFKLTHSRYLVTLAQDLKDQSGVVVLDFSAGKYPETLKYLRAQPGITLLSGENYTRYRLNKEDFTILVPAAQNN